VGNRAGLSAMDAALAGIALLLIAVGVFAFFSVKWWLAFIPLGIAAALILFVMFADIRRLFKEVEEKDNYL
jgi:hypothetical protein